MISAAFPFPFGVNFFFPFPFFLGSLLPSSSRSSFFFLDRHHLNRSTPTSCLFLLLLPSSSPSASHLDAQQQPWTEQRQRLFGAIGSFGDLHFSGDFQCIFLQQLEANNLSFNNPLVTPLNSFNFYFNS